MVLSSGCNVFDDPSAELYILAWHLYPLIVLSGPYVYFLTKLLPIPITPNPSKTIWQMVLSWALKKYSKLEKGGWLNKL